MNSDDDLRDAFQARAAHAPDATVVHSSLYDAIDRRRKRQQAGAVVGVSLAVTGMALGVRALQPTGARTDVAGSTSSSSTSSSAASALSSPTFAPTTTAPKRIPTTGAPSIRSTPISVPPISASGDGANVIGSDALPRNTFFSAGYTIDDAVALAAAWGADGTDATYTAKVVAGQLLVDGHDLPMPPGQKPPKGVASAVEAGTRAWLLDGYGLQDAEKLAQLWNDGAPIETVKALAGTQLLDGHAINFG